MLCATLEMPANGWRNVGPYLRPGNEETARLLLENIHPDFLDDDGRVNYGGIFFADVYHHLARLSAGLGIEITVDGRVMTKEELEDASL